MLVHKLENSSITTLLKKKKIFYTLKRLSFVFCRYSSESKTVNETWWVCQKKKMSPPVAKVKSYTLARQDTLYLKKEKRK